MLPGGLLRDSARGGAAPARARRRRFGALSGEGPPDKQPLHAVPGIIGFTRKPSRPEWRRAIITFAIGLVALVVLVLLVHPPPPTLATGSAAPTVRLTGGDGGQHTIAGPAVHRPVLIEFLASTCPTCRSTARQLCDAAAALPGATVAGIDGANESAAALNGFGSAYLRPPCAVTLLLDPNLIVSRAYEVSVVPTVYVIDSTGKIVFAGFAASGVSDGITVLRRLAGGG